MVGVFDKETIKLECPTCGKKTKKTLAWLKSNSKLTCVCGTTINTSQTGQALKKADQAVEKLRRTLQKKWNKGAPYERWVKK